MTITTPFAGNELADVTKARLTAILQAYGYDPSTYTTWGDARTDLNKVLPLISQSTIGATEQAGTFRPKLNALNASPIVNAPDLLTLYAYGATDAFDFVADQYIRSGTVGPSGLTVTRASSGYAETADGTLVNFGSNVLRRTDRGVLVEGARTNLLLRSQEFDDAAWTPTSAVTLTPTALASPSGVVDAYLMIATSGGGARGVTQTFTGTAAAHTFSLYAKPDSSTWFRVGTNDGSTVVNTWFNLSGAGSVGTSGAANTASIQAIGNGWYRLIITRTLAASASCAMTLRLANADNTSSATAGNSTYIWGAQVELGAFPSSYIPTVASTVTRAADVVTAVPTSGTDYPLSLYAEFERAVDTGGVVTILQTDAGTNNEATHLNLAAGGAARVTTTVGGTATNTIISGALIVGTPSKIAGRAQTNDVQIARDGTLGTLTTVAAMPTTPTNIRIGRRTTGNEAFGYIRRCAIFNTALSDADLEAITS
jgi:hypothetical protein